MNLKKKFTISQAYQNKSWTDILDEVKKCILICANCHAIRHTEEKTISSEVLEFINLSLKNI